MVAAAAGELSPAPSLDALKALARAGPVLATVDNVQWADLATAQALRPMPRLLASYPLSWILAMGTSSDGRPAELLFDLLESDGAAGSATRTRSRSTCASVPQARHQVARRAGPDRAGARAARDGANSMTGGCEAPARRRG
ncbi:MAG TPA: hypothetical protein VGI66_06865 [Streptosporangiaceae bacterium]